MIKLVYYLVLDATERSSTLDVQVMSRSSRVNEYLSSNSSEIRAEMKMIRMDVNEPKENLTTER